MLNRCGSYLQQYFSLVPHEPITTSLKFAKKLGISDEVISQGLAKFESFECDLK
jgi:hypothetical protein